MNHESLLSILDQMVEIPAGAIELRDDRSKRQWTVDLSTFSISKYPVTQELYYYITGESPSSFIGDKLPVETVSWKDAILFCNALSAKLHYRPSYFLNDAGEFLLDYRADGFRLPTEAEWEYACKASTKEIRYGDLSEIAWYKSNSGKTTHAVGLKKPNPWGLYDMLGNVWEWCTDIYDEEVYGSYRIFRGGGWFDEERGCLATNRRRSHPTSFKIDDLGFRLARNLT